MLTADDLDSCHSVGLANGDIIDGQDEGRSSFVRYINHSVRRANCQACDAWYEDDPLGMAAVYIETMRPIKAGEELLFDYGAQYWDEQGGVVGSRISPKRIIIDYF